MNQLPFSVYDFFGYLASGAVVLAGCTAAFVGYAPFEESPALLIGFILVITVYILGHIVANLSGDLIERRLVRARLSPPTDILLGFHSPKEWDARLFPGYSKPLPSEVQDRVKKLAEPRTGESLFFHCHAVMKSDSVVQGRLETFLNLYGFCRNMTLALLIVALFLGAGMILETAETGPDVGPGWWLAASVVGAVGMFYRYLKFYRQYGLELLTSFAEKDRER
jgi:hypothetical protein